jgi:hypothetical protein
MKKSQPVLYRAIASKRELNFLYKQVHGVMLHEINVNSPILP